MIERKTNLFKISTYLSENPILVLALIVYILLEFYSSFKHYKKVATFELTIFRRFFNQVESKLNSKQIDLIRILVNICLVVCFYLLISKYISLPKWRFTAPYFQFVLFVSLVAKPVNYLFDVFFDSPNKNNSKKNNSSKTFGTIERLAIGFLLLFKAFETIGLILAAKALVRENKAR